MIESLHVLDLAERRVLTRPRATLLGVLRDKFLHLGRGEDGAALVVTLAIFFLMYLGCMGVYAISMAVKERIHLQNAVDAAAYSAAVVQADTLSRIATINRAMSWTYVNMTREQMDYIVLRWLRHTEKHYVQDMEGADSYNKGGVLGPPCGSHGSCGVGWYIGSTPWGEKGSGMLRVRLNGLFVTSLMSNLGFDVGPLNTVSGLVGAGSTPLIAELQSALSTYDTLETFNVITEGGLDAQDMFSSVSNAVKNVVKVKDVLDEPPSNVETANSIVEMLEGLHGTGKYEGPGTPTECYLQMRIAMDRINIASMNIAERRLVKEMPSRISTAVNNILKAHLFAGMTGDCYYFVSQNENPLEDELTGLGDGYFGNLLNNEIGERRFLAFSGYSGNLVETFLGSSNELEDFLFSRIAGGLDQWFVRGNGHERTDGQRGLQRCYKHWADPDEPFKKNHMSHNPLPVSCWNTGKGENCGICGGDTYLHASPPSIALYSEWAWWSDVWSCPEVLFDVIHLHPMAHESKGWPWKVECDHNGSPGFFGMEDFKKFSDAMGALPDAVDDVERLVRGLLEGRTDTEGNPISIDKTTYSSAENKAALAEAIAKVEKQLAGGDGWQTTKPEGDVNSFASADSGVKNYEDGCLITYPALNLTEHFVGFARLYADSPQIYNSCYVGERAKPLILKTSYFGKAGTITVGVRWKNENMFMRFLKKIDGIFTAFDPDWNEDGTETHTYVFASAKAGYRNKGETQAQDDYSERAYRIDWDPNNQDWNLCQSDWDAVFVPVRRAASTALEGIWYGSDEGLLKDWVSTVSDWHRLNGQVLDDDDSWEKITAPRGVLRGNEHDGTKLKWEKLGRVMFH